MVAPTLSSPKSVPEMFKPQLSIALRQARIKDQLQAANEIALANLVLSHGDIHLDGINIRELAKLINLTRETLIYAPVHWCFNK